MSFEDLVQSLRHLDGNNGLPLPRVALGAVNKDGSFHFAKAFGEESKDTMETDAVHYLASSTKIITTIAALQCVEKGLLHLDANIGLVLPQWESPQVLTGFDHNDQPIFKSSTKFITLRHLLTHSSGLAYVFMEPLLTRYAQLPTAEPRNASNGLEQKFYPFLICEPGERWHYSPGVDWAGRMVEKVTSMKLGEYMKAHIFDLVSAKDSTFHLEDREDMRSRRANLWERVGDEIRAPDTVPWADPIRDDFGGGGLWSTVSDLLKIFSGILGYKLLHEDTVKSMFEPQLKTTAGFDNQPGHSASYRNAIYNSVPVESPVNFGLGGLMNLEAVPGRRAARSLTWSGMPNIYWWIDLENGVAGAYLSQLIPTGDDQAVKLFTVFEKFVYRNVHSLKEQQPAGCRPYNHG
ncbi:transesterase [Paraphaeosphaeria minitans]|uniref:Transesterase n=1 Tax=Paraphaeosphaeria minitans TaxID=565426 RepID=A0A9P6KJP4_9PLEO|nr:transesterase [Paraphaeosphaeria minitans]